MGSNNILFSTFNILGGKTTGLLQTKEIVKLQLQLYLQQYTAEFCVQTRQELTHNGSLKNKSRQSEQF